MSIFQDKKLILHISLEIIALGSMTYFFHTKSKSLELRVKSIEEQFSKEISILQDSISQLKKQLKKSEAAIEEIKYNKSVQQTSSRIHSPPPPPPLSKKSDTKRVEKNKEDEFDNILFTAFSVSHPPNFKQHATVELIDDIIEDKDEDKEDKEDKEEDKEENKEDNEDKEENKEDKEENKEDNEDKEDRSEINEDKDNSSALDKELENELKELEN